VDRATSVVETIHRSGAHVVGVQEALHRQLTSLLECLPAFAGVGRGRDPGGMGEHVPILFSTERLELEAHRDFWLSPNPDEEGSVGWDAAHPRICTVAIFTDRESGRRFAFFNVHFDHMGPTARVESAYLILKRMAEVPGLPAIVTGDFNDFPDSEAVAIFRAAGFRDALEVRGPEDGGDHASGTFHGFTGEPLPGRIDYVLCDGAWRVCAASIERRSAAGRLPSDHFPIAAELLLDPPA
jgi:endonuclease/exonuclease/phosphatase family metal-dependent hydrolase